MKVLCKKNYYNIYRKTLTTFKVGEYYDAKYQTISKSLISVYNNTGTYNTFRIVNYVFADGYLYDYFYTPEEMRQLKIKSLLDDTEYEK